MVFNRPIDAERKTFEPPPASDDNNSGDTEYDPFVALGKPAMRKEEMIEKMREHQNGEVQSRKLGSVDQFEGRSVKV